MIAEKQASYSRSGKYQINELVKEFGRLELNCLTTYLVQQYQTRRLNEGLKSASVNKLVNCMNSMLRTALEWDMLTEETLKAIRRIKVIVRFSLKPPVAVGEAYRLQARLITGRKEKSLVVPRLSVLQNADGGFYVFRLRGKVLQRVSVTVGLRSDLALEIAAGLSDRDRIVAHPDTTLSDGMKVKTTDSK